MSGKPRCNTVWRAVWEKVDGCVSFEVNTNGAIRATFLPGPFVKANDDGFGGVRDRLSVHGPKQGSRTGRHGQRMGKASTTLAASSEGDATKCIAEPGGSSCIRGEGSTKALSEGLWWT